MEEVEVPQESEDILLELSDYGNLVGANEVRKF